MKYLFAEDAIRDSYNNADFFAYVDFSQDNVNFLEKICSYYFCNGNFVYIGKHSNGNSWRIEV